MPPHNRGGEHQGLYVISVAARLVGTHPQTLRNYERWGFLHPARTARKVRLYSPADIERARKVRALTEEVGVNLAGVEVVLHLLDRLEALQHEMERALAQQRLEMQDQFERQLRRLLVEWSSALLASQRPAVSAGESSSPKRGTGP